LLLARQARQQLAVPVEAQQDRGALNVEVPGHARSFEQLPQRYVRADVPQRQPRGLAGGRALLVKVDAAEGTAFDADIGEIDLDTAAVHLGELLRGLVGDVCRGEVPTCAKNSDRDDDAEDHEDAQYPSHARAS